MKVAVKIRKIKLPKYYNDLNLYCDDNTITRYKKFYRSHCYTKLFIVWSKCDHLEDHRLTLKKLTFFKIEAVIKY